jgi:phosphoribosylformylglycinamidine synthase
VIGMVGLLPDHGQRVAAGFAGDGDVVVLAGKTCNQMGGSEYLKVVHGEVAGPAPALDLGAERAAHELVLAAAAASLLRSAHDVAEGGLLVALAECCLLGGTGARCAALTLAAGERLDAAFFGESQGRFVLSASPGAMPALRQLARDHHVELAPLGLTGGERVVFEGQLDVGLTELRKAWEEALL